MVYFKYRKSNSFWVFGLRNKVKSNTSPKEHNNYTQFTGHYKRFMRHYKQFMRHNKQFMRHNK